MTIVTSNTTLPENQYLIKTIYATINGETVNSVDARELHSFLESRQHFADWIKAKVVDSPFFQEDVDYILLHNHNSEQAGSGGHNRKDYALTIDTAMVLSLNERLPKGAEAYKYFCEFLGKQIVIKYQERMEYQFGNEIIKNLFSNFKIVPQLPVLGGKYRIDWYIPELKLAIEFDEPYHLRTIEKDQIRQEEIEGEIGCKFARYDCSAQQKGD